MTELFGDIVRRNVPAKRPLVNRSASLWIDHGKMFVVDAHANAVGIGVKMFQHEFGIAEG